MQHIKTLIFDLDGTLLDTLGDITGSVNYTLKALKLEPIEASLVRKYLGNGATKLWEKILIDQPKLLNDALTIYLPYLENHSKILTKPYPGIIDLLKQVKGKYKLAVISNKHQKALESVIDYYFKGIFDVVIGEGPSFPKKPDPQSMLHVLKRFNHGSEAALFIGDSEVDIQTAIHAQVQVIGVLWGFRDLKDIINEKPNYIVQNTTEILKIIGE